MGIKITKVLLSVLMITACNYYVCAQAKHSKNDTIGLAKIEADIEDFKPFVLSLTAQITKSGNLDSIKFAASPVVLLGDSLLNHIAIIFDGFYATHPQQYIPIENISDYLDHIMDTKTLDKAKKYNQKIITDYNNLMKAK